MSLKRIPSIRLIPLSFLAAIFVGAALLMLPVSTASGKGTNFITALFTSTTSVCVTGLTVVDTYSYWSTFGHVIIMGLIQIGGLGIITVITMIMLLTQKRFSLGERKMLQDSLNLSTDVGVIKMLIRIVRGTLIIELTGACFYAFAFIPDYGIGKGIWFSAFHAVSAFCNAGIDIIGNGSLEGYASNGLVLLTTMVLIILGGLGYVVWFDVAENIWKGIRRKWRPAQIMKRCTEHTKLVLTFTALLIVFGWIIFFLAEYKNAGTLNGMSLGDKLLNSLFESVTLRTAGFATVSQKAMTDVSCVIAYILMFIGGSPIGTAGGVKTVTFFLAYIGIVSYIRSEKPVIFNRKVPDEAMRKATAVVYLAGFTIIILTLMLMTTEHVGLQDALFEVISASATVGLSRGLTPNLHTIGQIVIIVAMYLGRIAPISLAIFFAGRKRPDDGCRYLEGKFYVG